MSKIGKYKTCWIPVKTCREQSPCQKLAKTNMLDTGQKILVKTKHAGYRSKDTGQNKTCWIPVKRYWSKQNMLDTGQKILVKTKHAGYRSKDTGQNKTCWIPVK